MEEWRDVPGYEDFYQVSNNGRVRGKERKVKYKTTGTRVLKARILKPKMDKYGYLVVNLSKNNSVKTMKVHRLVYMSFNGPIPECMQVNHINENKTDNRLENLNLMTASENTNWGSRNERAGKSQINGKKTMPVMQFTLDMELLQTWKSAAEIERQLGFNRNVIGSCCRHKKHCYTAYGYKWEYKKEVA